MATSSYEIDRQAAEWAAKRESGAMPPEEEAEFQAWLAKDCRNLGAYGRVVGTLARVERAGGFYGNQPHSRSGGSAKRLGDAPLWERRRVLLAGSVAASIGAVGFVTAAIWPRVHQNNFSTGLGLVREVPLADGSVVTLNTESEISLRYTERVREVRLMRGEALFDVAKDKSRPFIVVARGTQVQAVGTSFSVSVLPNRPVQVLVREGVVELKSGAASQAKPVRVGANMRAALSSAGVVVATNLPQAKVVRDLAWQVGQIAFDNETLRDAAAEFARYSSVRIVVDPAVAGRTVTGLYASNDPIGFARVSAAALDLRVQVNDNEVKLSE